MSEEDAMSGEDADRLAWLRALSVPGWAALYTDAQGKECDETEATRGEQWFVSSEEYLYVTRPNRSASWVGPFDGESDEAVPDLAALMQRVRRDVNYLYPPACLHPTLGTAAQMLLSLAEPIARAFHEAYERLAPAHGYETRKASAKPWSEVPKNNRNLMVATVASLLEQKIIGWEPPPGQRPAAPYPMSHNGLDDEGPLLTGPDEPFNGLRAYPMSSDPDVVPTFLPEGGTDEHPGHPPEAEGEIPGYWSLPYGSWSACRVDGLRVEARAIRVKGPARICGSCDWWTEDSIVERGYLDGGATASWVVTSPTGGQASKISLVISGSATLLEAIRAVDRIHPPPSWIKVSS